MVPPPQFLGTKQRPAPPASLPWTWRPTGYTSVVSRAVSSVVAEWCASTCFSPQETEAFQGNAGCTCYDVSLLTPPLARPQTRSRPGGQRRAVAMKLLCQKVLPFPCSAFGENEAPPPRPRETSQSNVWDWQMVKASVTVTCIWADMQRPDLEAQSLRVGKRQGFGCVPPGGCWGGEAVGGSPSQHPVSLGGNVSSAPCGWARVVSRGEN